MEELKPSSFQDYHIRCKHMVQAIFIRTKVQQQNVERGMTLLGGCSLQYQGTLHDYATGFILSSPVAARVKLGSKPDSVLVREQNSLLLMMTQKERLHHGIVEQ